jgi:iron complex outermembrane receptor protein
MPLWFRVDPGHGKARASGRHPLVTTGPAVSPETGLGIRCVAVGGMERLPSSTRPLSLFPRATPRPFNDAGVRHWETFMKLYPNPLWPALGLSLTLSPSLWAASSLPTIVISASRIEQQRIVTPTSISLITREEIEASGAQDLPQLLQARGGVQINSLYGTAHTATIDMRGFGSTASRNTLILVDGRRLNNSGDLASPDLASIDLSRVERVEIVQGSASILYGNQAVGGLINIITRTPEAFDARVEAGVGSYSNRSLRANLGHQLDNGLSFRLNARKEESDNYRDNNRTELQDLNLRLDYTHDHGRIFIEQQALDDEQELPGSLFDDELNTDRRQSASAYDGDYSETRTDLTRIGLEQDLSLNWRLEAEASYRRNDREFQTSFRTFPGTTSTQDRKVKGFNPRIIGLLPLAHGEATFTAGADLERTDYLLETSFGPQALDQSIDAYYLQLTAPVSPILSATIGWRQAGVDNRIDTGAGEERLDDDVKTGSFGLTARPAAGLRLFIRVDENYRFATVDEHTNVVYGQPVGIKNQTGISQEAGAEWQHKGLNAKAVVYRLELEDEISFDTTGFTNTNLDETRREGLILEARWQASPGLALSGSFTYTEPTITAGAFEGNQIPLVSARSARLGVDWLPAQDWGLFAETLLRSERAFGGDFANDFGTLPGYGVVNAGGRYSLGPWRLGLRVDNLLNKEYIASGSVGYDASFTQREAYFPAPERSFWLTASYQFE